MEATRARDKEICGLLEQQVSPIQNFNKTQIWQQLQHYSQFPDFNNYLAFVCIMVRDDSYVNKSKVATATFHVDGLYSTLKISNSDYTQPFRLFGSMGRNL